MKPINEARLTKTAEYINGYERENGAAYKEYPAEEGQVFGVVEFVIHNPRAV